VEKVAFDFATIEPLITLTLGLAKALTWYFIIQTVSQVLILRLTGYLWF
jgi:hypothetical protein